MVLYRDMKLGMLLVAIVACTPSHADLPDAAVAPDAAACTAPTGAGTMHASTISQPETWTAAGSPHVVPYDLTISATVTIEACSTVQVGPGKTITLATGGRIVAAGTA